MSAPTSSICQQHGLSVLSNGRKYLRFLIVKVLVMSVNAAVIALRVDDEFKKL